MIVFCRKKIFKKLSPTFDLLFEVQPGPKPKNFTKKKPDSTLLRTCVYS